MAEEEGASATATKDSEAGAKKGLPKGMIGIALGVVVMIALGIGAVMFAKSMFASKEDEGGEHGAHGGHKAGAHEPSLLESAKELALGDLISNIKGKDGRRYVKVTCVLWIDHDLYEIVIPHVESGGHGGGGNKDEGGEVKRLLRMRMEEHLKSYDLDELNSQDVISRLRNGFRTEGDRELHKLFPAVGQEKRFVKEVVLNNLLLQ
jgi:hypothetical protein